MTQDLILHNATERKQKTPFVAPLNFKALRSVSSGVDFADGKDISILIFIDRSVDAAFLASMQEALRPQGAKVSVLVRGYDDKVPDLADVRKAHARGDRGKKDTSFAMVIVLAAESSCTGELIREAKTLAKAVVVITTRPELLVAQLEAELILAHIKDIIPVPLTETLSAKDDFTDENVSRVLLLDAVLDELADWVARRLANERILLAQAYPFMRRAVALEMTRKTAFDNVIISGLFFLPGADMPPLTLNQVKLLIQIAALFDLPLGMARIKEIVLIVAGAFGFRAFTRLVISRLPILGFVARIGVSYSATYGIGVAAFEFYDKQRGDFVVLWDTLKDIFKDKLMHKTQSGVE